jgi:hypothetical protein
MKNMLSENMMRFGTKNLGPEQKRRLTLESVMQTINEHGLHGEVRRRLSEQKFGTLGELRPGNGFCDVYVARTSKKMGQISPGKYVMTQEGDYNTGGVKVTTKAATFYLASSSNEKMPMEQVAYNINRGEMPQEEAAKTNFYFVVDSNGGWSWQADGKKPFNAQQSRHFGYITSYSAKGGAQPR